MRIDVAAYKTDRMVVLEIRIERGSVLGIYTCILYYGNEYNPASPVSPTQRILCLHLVHF